MSQKVLQVNFNFSISPEKLGEEVAPLADPIANVEGLIWKVWIMNPDVHEAGGIYLFSDQSTLDSYTNSEIVKVIMAHPALSNFSVKTFDVLEEFSLKTRAPVGAAMTN